MKKSLFNSRRQFRKKKPPAAALHFKGIERRKSRRYKLIERGGGKAPRKEYENVKTQFPHPERRRSR